LLIVSICLGIPTVLAMIAVSAAGVIFLIRYGKNRKQALIIIGLTLAFLLPGCLILLGIAVLLPQAFILHSLLPPPYIS
jgi:hypothetical protein